MLTKFIVKGLNTLTIVRQPGFREFCKAMDPKYVLPTYRTLRRKYIPMLDKEVMDEVREDFKTVKHVALTSDGWSSPVNYFSSISS